MASRLESPLVTFHGSPSQALDTELKGSVALTCSDSLGVKAVKVYLEGIRKISYVLGLPSRSVGVGTVTDMRMQ